MSPLNQSKSVGPQDLEAVELAVDEAWAKLSGRVHDPKSVDAIKDALRRKIVQVAKAGIKKPADISALALDYMPPLNATFPRTKIKRHV